MSKLPTQEQIKEFWEWCGYTGKLDYIEDIGEEEGKFVYKFPPIDLNNLFKYAVPKLRYVSLQHSDQYQGAISAYYAQASIQFGDNHAWADDDPALALFWALWQMKEVK